MDAAGSQRCWVSTSFMRIRVWRVEREIHLCHSHGESFRLSSVIWSKLRDLEKGALLRLLLDRFPPNLLSCSVSPGNIPTQDKEQQGKQAVWGEGVQWGEGMLWTNPKRRNVVLNFSASVLTDVFPIGSVLVQFWACVILLAHSWWVRLHWVGKIPL